jgi:hypothetical protein
MKRTNWPFAAICVPLALPLTLSTGNARDADLVLAAAHTAKQHCMNTCRARYRDCRHLKKLPSFECRDVYRDCTRYTCTGLGPG